MSPEWTQHADESEYSSIQYDFRVTCDTHYYGKGCADLCRPRDDQFGHYTCSSTGSIVCLSGWQGDYCTKRKCFLLKVVNGYLTGGQFYWLAIGDGGIKVIKYVKSPLDRYTARQGLKHWNAIMHIVSACGWGFWFFTLMPFARRWKAITKTPTKNKNNYNHCVKHWNVHGNWNTFSQYSTPIRLIHVVLAHLSKMKREQQRAHKTKQKSRIANDIHFFVWRFFF